MAESKKILASDVIEKDIFQNTDKSASGLIETLKKLLSVVDELKVGFKDQLTNNSEIIKETKLNLERAESIRKVNEVSTKSRQIRVALTEAQKQELKIKRQLTNLETKLSVSTIENATAIEKTKIQLAEQRKEAKKLAKEQLGLTGEYDRQSKRLDTLRKSYKDLVLQQGRGAKGAIELKREIDELDKTLKDLDKSVGQSQRNVGNYPEIFNNVSDGAKTGFADLGNLINTVLIGSFADSRDEARTLSVGVEQFKNGFRVFGLALVSLGKDVIFPFFENLGLRAEKTFLKVKQGLLEATNLFGKNNEQIKDNSKTLDELNKKIEENSNKIDSAKNPFDGFNNRVSDSNSLLRESLELQDRLLDITGLRIKQIEELASQEELQQLIADDTTKSFNEREKAIKNVLDIQKERLAVEVDLAEKNLEVAVLEVKNDFLRRNQLELFNEEQVRSLSFLEDKQKADLISLDTLQKITEASTQLQSIQNEANKQEEEAIKVNNELKQDRLERDLDILIDGFDNQKTINERIIADDKRTFEERQELLDKTTKLANESFKEQKDVLAQLSAQGIDVDELLGLDATELAKRIRQLEQSEIIEGRTLEVVRERRLVLQDLEEAQRDLTDAQLESLKRIQESQQAIIQDDLELELEKLESRIDNEELNAKEVESILNESIEIQKKALLSQAKFEKKLAEQEIKDEKELSAKKKEIQEKLNNDLERIELEKQQKVDEIQKNFEKERLENRKELLSQIINETQNEINKVFELRNQANEKEIENRQKSVDIQEERARQGQENQLAFEQERLAQAEIKRREDLERQRRAEEAIRLSNIYLEAYLNALGQPDTNAAQAGVQAFAAAALAKGVSRGIAGNFIEGTEMVERDLKGNKVHNRTDGYHIAVDGKERILNPEQNAKIGNISNDELAQMAFDYRTGVSPYIYKPISENVFVESKNDNTDVIYAINNLGKIVKENASKIDVDKLGNLIHQTYKNGIKTTTKYKNRPRL